MTADIVVATPEKLDFAIRQDPNVLDDVGLIVFDEGHMIGLGSREIRYEVLIQRLLRREDASSRRIVCLSAMFNDKDPYFDDFGRWLRRDEAGDMVHVNWRPTRRRTAFLEWSPSLNAAQLTFLDGEKPYVRRFVLGIAETDDAKAFPGNDKELCVAAADRFVADGHTVLIYSPQRRLIEPLAEEFAELSKAGLVRSVKPPSADELKVALAIGREWLGDEHPAMLALKLGIGTHHATLPRAFQSAIERLLNDRKLSVVVASPTLAQGVDLACSVLLFRSLERFDALHKKIMPISPAEFSNVVGRAGRAFVDVEGIVVLPTYVSGYRRRFLQDVVRELNDASSRQSLESGLLQLVATLIGWLSQKFGVNVDEFAEHVLNQPDFWADPNVTRNEAVEGEDEAVRTLDDFVADLDVAILTLIEPLDAPEQNLAKLVDDILHGSLFARSMAREEVDYSEEALGLIRSRASWLWRNTNPQQRVALYFSGLGQSAGVFLYENLDAFVDLLAALNAAAQVGDPSAVGDNAAEFVMLAMSHRFFGLRKLPEDPEGVVRAWTAATAFSQMLDVSKKAERQLIQAFVQDGLVFKLVWAAEAVRVQARAAGHPRADELGDGPALCLTHGVPSISAALLCQAGFASRTGALWATQKLGGGFKNGKGMENWALENAADLADSAFWDTAEQHVLWMRSFRPAADEVPRTWETSEVHLPVSWLGLPAERGRRVRVLPEGPGIARICSEDLRALGTADLPLNWHTGFVDAHVGANGEVIVERFGPP